jgi:phage-related protein (TIGR01555 family)
MDKHNNSLLDFTQSLGAESSAANTMAFNKRYGAITLNRALLSSTYMEEGIVQVLIDQPVDDAFRGGIKIKCDEMSGDEIKELEQAIDQEQILDTYAQGLKWMRLFGGAGIIINIGQDMRQPLNIESIKDNTPLKFYAVDRWELSYTPYGMNALDQMGDMTAEHPYNYYGHVMHHSNVIKLNGKLPPSILRGQFSGWGMSELEKIVRSFNQYLKHQNVTFELLDEAKIDVMKIAGFNIAIASTKGAQKTAERIGLAAQVKNFQNALVIDKEDEYEQKSMNFSGLSEILNQIRIGLACDLRMPMTKLFGISPSGLNASGEEEIENYNSMVETDIRSKVKSGLITMIKILCKKKFDYIPENINFEWKPLREQSSQEVSVLKNEVINRVTNCFLNGLITNKKAIEIINNEKVFSIELDSSESLSLEDRVNITGNNEMPDTVKTEGGRGTRV